MILKLKGGKVNYTDSGNGQVIVLLHGYLESSEVWNVFAEKLAADFRVLSADLPGHGKSDIFHPTHSMEFMASVVKDLLDSIGLKKVFICGHSLGGYVALAFLELYPDYLSGYSLFHSHPFADSAEAIEKRLREIAIVKAGKKELMYPDNVTRMFATSNIDKFSGALKKSKKIASGIPGDGIIAVLRGMIERPSRLTLMEAGKKPCLWILGSMDNYIPCEISLSRVNLPLNAKAVILENSGHLGFIEETDKALIMIKEFILNFIPEMCVIKK